MSWSKLMRQASERTAAGVRQAFRGVLKRLDATKPIPPAQVAGLAGEALAVELLQHYGIATAPLAGAEVLVLPVGGRSGHGVIIASVDGRYRIELQPGEVALHTDEGDHLHFKRGRIVELGTETLNITATNKVRIDTPKVEMTGDATAEGDMHADGDVSDGTRSMQADRDIYNKHKHPGVQTGAGQAQPTEEQQ